MNQVAVIINVLTAKGRLIADYLSRNGFIVYGVDRQDFQSDVRVNRFFRMDIKHRESLELLMKITNPTVVIYCWEKPINSLNTDYSLFGYWRLLIYLLAHQSRLLVCIDKDINVPFEPASIDEFSQVTLFMLTKLFKDEYGTNVEIISDKDNLLKTVKELLIKKGGEGS